MFKCLLLNFSPFFSLMFLTSSTLPSLLPLFLTGELHAAQVRQMSTSLDYALSMRPEYHQAVLDIIRHYRWDDVIYLYDSEDGQ